LLLLVGRLLEQLGEHDAARQARYARNKSITVAEVVGGMVRRSPALCSWSRCSIVWVSNCATRSLPA
jgi:hypothetical protein